MGWIYSRVHDQWRIQRGGRGAPFLSTFNCVDVEITLKSFYLKNITLGHPHPLVFLNLCPPLDARYNCVKTSDILSS